MASKSFQPEVPNLQADMRLAGDAELERLLGSALFQQVPFNLAVIDRDFHVLAANNNFEEYFGNWRNHCCYEVHKRSAHPCAHCQAKATFEDGRVRVSDETGVDRHGRTCHYVVHLAPLRGASGRIDYLIEMTTDLTETRSWQREFDVLFERVPCAAFVIDREFRVVRGNEKFRQTFGEPQGKCCFEVCKRRKVACRKCIATQTFADGGEHTSHEVGTHRDGSPAYYVVNSSPLSRGQEGVVHVIQMITDWSESCAGCTIFTRPWSAIRPRELLPLTPKGTLKFLMRQREPCWTGAPGNCPPPHAFARCCRSSSMVPK